MPKVTVSFDLPEEREEFQSYLKGPAAQSVIWDFGQWLRTNYKYVDEASWPNFEQVREKFYQLVRDEDIDTP